MKAITYEQYGSPSVLKLSKVQKSEPKDDDLIIKYTILKEM